MSWEKKLPPPIQPGAPHDSAYSLMFGLSAFACSISHHS